MKIVKIVIIFLISAAFLLVPFPAADVNFRLHFKDTVEGSCALYYATDTAGFSQEQCIIADVESETNRVTFHLDSSLENSLKGLRLDFPDGNNLICVDKVTISSAGIVQKQYDPSMFFGETNITNRNDIQDISLATAQDRAYVLTNGADPYVLLSSVLVEDVKDSFSHLFLTRLGILLFVAGCYFMYRKNLFSQRSRQEP